MIIQKQPPLPFLIRSANYPDKLINGASILHFSPMDIYNLVEMTRSHMGNKENYWLLTSNRCLFESAYSNCWGGANNLDTLHLLLASFWQELPQAFIPKVRWKPGRGYTPCSLPVGYRCTPQKACKSELTETWSWQWRGEWLPSTVSDSVRRSPFPIALTALHLTSLGWLTFMHPNPPQHPDSLSPNTVTPTELISLLSTQGCF